MRWNSTTRHRFYHTDLGQNCSSISQFCNANCTHSVFRTIEARVGLLLTKKKKKMPKITYTASRFSLSQFELWSSVTLQHNKEFIMFIFFIIIIISLYLMFLSMCNLQKRLIRAAFWVLLQATFTERLKTNGTAIKIRREIVKSRIYIEFSKSIQSMKKHYFY